MRLRTLVSVVFLFMLAVSAVGTLSGCDSSSENVTKCSSNADCVGIGSNPYCNRVEGICLDKGKCENHTDCENFYPDMMVPYCNSQGICVEKGPCTSNEDCPIDNYVCKPDGSCAPSGGEDGDEVIDGDGEDSDVSDGDGAEEDTSSCPDLSGAYDVTITCGSDTNSGVASVVMLPDSCDVIIYYPGGTLQGTVDDSGNIHTTEDKTCDGSVGDSGLELTCTDGCTISGGETEYSGIITVDPQTLDFGSVLAGSSKDIELTITNIGDSTLHIYNIELTPDTHSDFSFALEEGTSLPVDLEQGKDLTVTVTLTATDNSHKRGNLVISNSSETSVVIVPMSSEPKGVSNIEVEPDVLDLGSAPTGATNSSFFYIKNTGDADGIIVNVEITDDSNGAFELGELPDMSPPTFHPLASHTSMAVDVMCHPLEGVHVPPAGGVLPLEGHTKVTYMDPQTGSTYDIDVLLKCTVVEPSPPCISITPLDGMDSMFPIGCQLGCPGMRFGFTQLYSNDARPMVISNCGDEDLVINKIEYGPPPFGCGIVPGQPCPPEFTTNPILPILTPITIPRGDSFTLDITFSPTSEGTLQTWSIVITSNAHVSNVPFIQQMWDAQANGGMGWDRGIVHFGLSGTGATRAIDVLPSKIDFGLITLGCCSRPETISVYDTGQLELTINEIRMNNGSDPGFEILNVPPLPYTLRGGDILRFQVRYCAAQDTPEGMHYGTVLIKSNDQNNTEFTVPVQAEATRMVHQVDTFHQNDKPTVDILWVVDCSGSMGEEQDNLADNFETFIQTAVNWDADIQIGVTDCDLDTAGHSGRLQGSPKIIRFGGANSMTRQEAMNAFEDNIHLGTNCSGTEKGLEAAHLALSPPLITDPAENGGFLRDNAALVIIFVSDEEDQSTSDTSYYIDFFRNIKGARNVEMLQVYAIVGDCSDGCQNQSTGEASAGCRYVDVANACGGFFRSICSDNWSAIYQDIGDRAFGLRSQFFLSRLADESTLSVTVNGQQMENGVDYVYDEESNSIIFNDPPAAGSDIVAEYDAMCLH